MSVTTTSEPAAASSASISEAAAANRAPQRRVGAGVDGAADHDDGAALVEAVHRSVLDATSERDPATVDISEFVRALVPLARSDFVESIAVRVSERVHGLGPVEPLLADPSVSEVMVNGPGPVWIERHGVISATSVCLDRSGVDLLVERIVAPLGRRVDQRTPCVDGRLPDGSRVHVAVPPVAVDGPYVTIRRFVVPEVALEMFAGRAVVGLLDELIERGANIVVSGGTGAGKTTLLNALAGRVSAEHRMVTIEDAAELRLDHPHVVRLESRPESREGGGAVTIRDLVRNALRMRPDRLVVGEVRGAEALDLLHALNTGHAGCLSTLHANSPVDALRRLAILATAADERLPVQAVREHIVAAIDAIVHVKRTSDGERRIAEVAEVAAHDSVRPLVEGDSVCGSLRRAARLAASADRAVVSLVMAALS